MISVLYECVSVCVCLSSPSNVSELGGLMELNARSRVPAEGLSAQPSAACVHNQRENAARGTEENADTEARQGCGCVCAGLPHVLAQIGRRPPQHTKKNTQKKLTATHSREIMVSKNARTYSTWGFQRYYSVVGTRTRALSALCWYLAIYLLPNRNHQQQRVFLCRLCTYRAH